MLQEQRRKSGDWRTRQDSKLPLLLSNDQVQLYRSRSPLQCLYQQLGTTVMASEGSNTGPTWYVTIEPHAVNKPNLSS